MYTQPDDNPKDHAWQEAKWLKERVPGLLFGREVRYLYDTANRVGPGLYADLGTFQGLSSASLAKGAIDAGHNSHIWTFDTFEGTGVRAKFHPEEGSLTDVKGRLDYLGLSDPITFVPGRFSDSVKCVQTLRFDFIFIDGSHDYESVTEDFDNWSPLLKVGGELAFHDANIKSHNKQVWKLMEELERYPEWEKFAEERTLMAWKKLA